MKMYLFIACSIGFVFLFVQTGWAIKSTEDRQKEIHEAVEIKRGEIKGLNIEIDKLNSQIQTLESQKKSSKLK